ncbi:SpoIIE family protein phosphatase [Thermomonospora cellulosilytica]|uniref:Serine phosphatase RsbU (Regulator of sigma subunit) n=1 Tax=Thermomonospora cellulosilytica TaxID=1411118 RepID=A0A7W3N2Z8_9ACTN|nr:SpoIIE family protein phosphatase [Thermomonospora cellulosilytica]MBA9006580.1 serine phosphatase RsbU (regulator of sigma subunit) [Thermomonospora cellulosilytica]
MRGAEAGSSGRGMEQGPRSAAGQGVDERALLDALDEAVVVLGPDGTVVRSNAAACRLLGDPPAGREPGSETVSLLAEAVRRGRRSFDGPHGGRWLNGRRVPLPDGAVAWLVRDVTEQREVEAALREDRERWTRLSSAARALSGTLNLRRTWGLAARLTVDGLADHCGVTLRTEGAATETAVAGPGGGVAFSADEPLRPSVARVLAEGRREVHDGVPPAQARELCPPGIEPDRAVTVVLLPLMAKGTCFGVMTLVRARPYGAAELSLIGDHADRVALALDAARLHDRQVRMSQRLRSALLPPALPEEAGLRLGAAYRPASEDMLIGGDFYEMLPDPSGGWVFALGDVCGKGVDAAVYTGRVRQALRTAAVVDSAPLAMLELLNRTLMSHDQGGFVTLLVGRPEVLPDGAVRVRLAGGGHPPPLVLRRGGEVETVKVTGMFAGAFDDASFEERDVLLAPGDMLLLYTDGVTEARDDSGRMYGEQRLVRDLGTCAGAPPGAAVERLMQLVLEYLRRREHDDIALLALQAWPEGGP